MDLTALPGVQPGQPHRTVLAGNCDAGGHPVLVDDLFGQMNRVRRKAKGFEWAGW